MNNKGREDREDENEKVYMIEKEDEKGAEGNRNGERETKERYRRRREKRALRKTEIVKAWYKRPGEMKVGERKDEESHDTRRPSKAAAMTRGQFHHHFMSSFYASRFILNLLGYGTECTA